MRKQTGKGGRSHGGRKDVKEESGSIRKGRPALKNAFDCVSVVVHHL